MSIRRRGRLPGDIYIQGERGSLYIPITTSILVSLALSLPAVAVLSLTSALVCFASLSVDTFRKLAHRRSRSCNRHARRPIPKPCRSLCGSRTAPSLQPSPERPLARMRHDERRAIDAAAALM